VAVPLAMLALFSAIATALPADPVIRAVDALTRAPVAGAIVTIGGKETRTDPRGRVVFHTTGDTAVYVRAHGYWRADVAIPALGDRGVDICDGRATEGCHLSVRHRNRRCRRGTQLIGPS
jgi:hypothetical protein